MNRRHFLKTSAMAGAGALALRGRAWPFAQSPTNIRKFIVSLPGLTPAGANNYGQYLPVATSRSISFGGLTTDSYNLAVMQFTESMHPDLPGPTTFWGYNDLNKLDSKYLGQAIVGMRNRPVILNVTNKLPNKPIVPIDRTISAGDGITVGQLPYNRICTHLHGGFTPWFSDGTPYQWFTPGGQHGPSFMNIPGRLSIPGTGQYYYPNQASARFAWYHDHAMGITRTNAYCGIASAYLLIDDFELGLVNSGMLSDLVGIPLVIQDKSFVAENILQQDPTWYKAGGGPPGSLWYPHQYEVNIFADGTTNPKGRWDWGQTATPPATGTSPLPTPTSLVPEAFFDTTLINGGLYPTVSVPPKRVRFRMLNGNQARFYHLNLYAEDPSNPGEANTSKPGPVMFQVGTEGGFLTQVAIHANTTPLPLVGPDDANPDGPFNLLLAPAERADVVIDFNGVPAGSSFILYSDAVAPFPSGDSRNDYYTGDPNQTAIGGAPTTQLGHGPNTRTLLKITVTSGVGDSVPTIPTWLNTMNGLLQGNYASGNQPALLYNDGVPWQPEFPFEETETEYPIRKLTLNEDFDEYGRLIQTLGTFDSKSLNNQGIPTWGLPYMAPATETPAAGSIEVWQIMNLTGDTHPIHFHLVNVQVIQRQQFAGAPDNWSYVGPPMAPDPNEVGWKETVRMNPGEITTVIMQFNLPNLPTAAMRNAVSPRTGGHEYVWHCHILEHEEHDMMRPLIVT